MEIKKEKNINLDIIRIFATMMVLFTHIGQTVGFEFNGSSGVTCFFILSGYLACASLDSCISPIDYYKRRVVRIIPSYYLCLIILFCTDLLLGVFVNNSYFEYCEIKFLRYVFFLQEIVPSNNFWIWCNNNALWTMSSFFVFYLLAPAIKKYFNSFFKVLMSIFIIFVILHYSRPFIISFLTNNNLTDQPELFFNWSPFKNIFSFLIGYLIYYSVKSKYNNYVLIISAFMIIYIAITQNGETYITTLLYFILINLAICRPQIVRKSCITAIIKEFSKITFLIYLMHPIVLTVINENIPNYIIQSNKLIYSLLLLTLSIVLAYVSFYPVRKMEDKLKIILSNITK